MTISARRRQFRVVALLVIAAAVVLIVWLGLRDTGASSSSKTQGQNATAVSIAQINNLATSVGHPVFWIGPRKGDTYELSRASNGSIYLRYLPHGVKVGAAAPYLTVATYPFAGAFAALQSVAKQKGSTPVKLAHGGLAVVSATYPESVHIAYPGVDYQVEVYDPTPGIAMTLVAGSRLAALGGLETGSATVLRPTAVSVAGLTSSARTLGHPIYWVGPKKGYTYELTQTSNGQVFVRYLPAGVKVGASQPYLTVATYPFPKAFAAMRALATEKGETSIKLNGGGLAVLDAQYLKSIHLAFPGSNYEVEVFDPVPAVVRQIVSAGQVSAIG